MQNGATDTCLGISYKDMKTLNEIDKIRLENIKSTSEIVNKRFEYLIDLLSSSTYKK
ncbi:hypothetical protein J7E55_25865 [Bacillus sp. ISL-53]|nr:hypothetical protein [Bacillus sp. ISL-53]